MAPDTNVHRFESRPVSGGGTRTDEWRAWNRHFDDLDVHCCPALMVVAPHPDDETLGLGATMATLAARGIPVEVVCVSDGGAAHPHLGQQARRDLEATRRGELDCAAAILGLPEPVKLGHPDGQLSRCEGRITADLSALLAERPAGTWCAGTWRGDGHPDHEAVGRAVIAAANAHGARPLEYPVWMWHWAVPDDAAVPWHRGRRLPVTDEARKRKEHAVNGYRSQTHYGPGGVDPVLPPAVVARLLNADEIVFL